MFIENQFKWKLQIFDFFGGGGGEGTKLFLNLLLSCLLFPRLRNDNNGGAWCPKHMVARGLKEYLQVDLLQMHVVTAIKTQGRFGKGQGQEYTETYVVEYWRPGFLKWERWKSIQGKEVNIISFVQFFSFFGSVTLCYIFSISN